MYARSSFCRFRDSLEKPQDLHAHKEETKGNAPIGPGPVHHLTKFEVKGNL